MRTPRVHLESFQLRLLRPTPCLTTLNLHVSLLSMSMIPMLSGYRISLVQVAAFAGFTRPKFKRPQTNQPANQASKQPTNQFSTCPSQPWSSKLHGDLHTPGGLPMRFFARPARPATSRNETRRETSTVFERPVWTCHHRDKSEQWSVSDYGQL